MQLINRLRAGTKWSLFSRVASAALGFVITIVLARILTVNDLGAYYMFLQIIGLAGLLAKIGMDYSLQKVLGIAADNNNWYVVRVYTRMAAFSFMLASFFVITILYFLWELLTVDWLAIPVLSGMFVFAALAIILRSFEELGSSYFRGLHESKIGVFVLDVPRQLILVIVFSVFFIFIHMVPIEFAVMSYVGASVISTLLIVVMYVLWLRSHRVEYKKEKKEDVSIISFWLLSFPMLLNGGAAIILSSGDMWVLGIFSTAQDVAVYGTVVRLTTLMVFSLSVVNMVIPSLLATSFDKGDYNGMEKILRTSAGWSVYLVLPLLLIFLFWGDSLLTLVFGSTFAIGAFVLAVLAIGHSVNALSGSPGVLLQMTGYQYLLLYLTLAWGVINLVMNLFLVKIWSMNGVAIATAFCIIGLNLSMVYFAKSKLNIKTWVKLHSRL